MEIILKGIPGKKEVTVIKVIAGHSNRQLRSKQMRMEKALGSSDLRAHRSPRQAAHQQLRGLGTEVQVQGTGDVENLLVNQEEALVANSIYK